MHCYEIILSWKLNFTLTRGLGGAALFEYEGTALPHVGILDHCMHCKRMHKL